jgi:class 3 adenylate cyclase
MSSCLACGSANPDRAKFCVECGTPLTGLGPTRDERKVVSVLFCDLVGFTQDSETADPEDVSARLRSYHARMREEIERFGGTVEKFIGDAVMAVFRRWPSRCEWASTPARRSWPSVSASRPARGSSPATW